LPERADKMAKRFSARAYTDYKEMLRVADVDAVHICTPHYLHASMAIDALDAGKYVLCEKPMAVTVEEGRQMIAADERAGGKHLCIVFQNRYNAASRKFKEIIDSGCLGKLIGLRGSVCWKRGADYYSDAWHGKAAYECGGVMINQAIHTLDLVQYLGGGAYSVAGERSIHSLRGIIEVEDTANAYIRMKSGITALFYATVAYVADTPIEIEGVFENGTILMKGDRLFRWEDSGLVNIVTPNKADNGHKGYWGIGHNVQIEDFYATIRAGEAFKIDGTQALEAVKLFRGIYESSESGEEVILN